MFMFIRYIISRKSWIFYFLLGVTNTLIILNEGIKVNSGSILYLNAVYFITFLFFFLWCYKKETKFTASLDSLRKELPTVENVSEKNVTFCIISNKYK
ncbi:hypothetical protein [Gracilibacillus kekensis]|uniref:Uncharacterized protein n=1 Tax=Gracilibacillus kekensis TaxID=1027249 RepID=A0A1M7Q6I9_9BACI|nr:hypothetical protein [Gracilibacillus kekensis]SHN26106.1 hypothetical protein SAMN05216179_2814 [Gracilibacillus kekensis]